MASSGPNSTPRPVSAARSRIKIENDASCIVCRRPGCQLQSHKAWAARQVIDTPKATQKAGYPRSLEKPYTSSYAYTRTPLRATVPHSIDSGRLDGFHDLPVAGGHRPELHHAVYSLLNGKIGSATAFPLPAGMAVNEIGGSMLIPVMSDTSLCLSVIAAWKAVQFQAGQAASFPYLSYEAQALQSLRKQLHVMGPRRVTDEAVIAAAILWATAAMFAQPEPLRRHVAGVRALVAARGGLADLGHAGSTAQLILWADLLTAQFLDEDVCFKDIGPSDPLPPSLVKLRASIALPPPFDRLLPDTSEAARDMRLLLLCHDKALRTEHISFAEYKALMGLLNQSTIFWVGLQEKYKGSSTSDECVILAMNLLRLTVFFHAAPLLTIVTTVLERLRLALVRCGIGQFLDSVDIYIWACLVGMVNNLHADARSQFADMLAHALTTKYKNGWPVDWQAEILLLLRSFLWSDSVLTTMLPAACQLVEARVCPTKKTCLATQSVTLS